MGEWNGVELTGVALAEPRPGGIRLRPYQPADVPAVYAGMQDPAMHRYLPIPNPYTEVDAHHFCTTHGPGHARDSVGLGLGIENADGVLVGGAGLTWGGTAPVAEIGYSVYAGARGHGYAARATRLLAAWGFGHGLTRIDIRVSVANQPSLRSALAAGFRFEAVHRDRLPWLALTDVAGRPVPGATAGAADGSTDEALFARVAGDSGDAVPPWLPPLPDTPPIDDGVVELRLMDDRTCDVAAVRAALDDPVSQHFQLGAPTPDSAAAAHRTAAHARLGWLVGTGTRVAVVEIASGEVASIIEIRPAGPPQVLELGYSTVPAFRGRGLLVRGLRLLADWLAAHSQIARLELGTAVENIASQRVAERAGFVGEGVSARRLRRGAGPDFVDERRYARLLTR